MRRVAVLIALVAGCNGDVLTLHYHLEGVDAAAIASVETTIVPVDPERFAEPTDIITIDTETRFRVGCGVADCNGKPLVMLVDRQPPDGASVPTEFSLQFRAGASSPTHLLVSATALGVGAAPGSEPIARSLPVETAFSGATVELYIRPKSLCGAINCEAGQACCADRCIDVSGDATNCGDCGVTCTAGEQCGNGVCSCAGGDACAPGASCCDQGCVDTSMDPNSCGACGTSCGAGETCGPPAGKVGACACGMNAACTATESCCGDTGECVKAGEGCICNGAPCAPGLSCCAQACVDVKSKDPSNCGACGHVCPQSPGTSGDLCVLGQCQCNNLPCNKDCCDSGCTDLQDDPRNCGHCATTCNGGEDCAGGGCSCKGGPACPPGRTCCGIGSCPDLGSDVNNCGACGHVCGMAETCSGGICQPPGCNPICMNGNSCNTATNTCLCGGGTAACQLPKTCCSSDGSCSNLDSVNHCGDCNVVCGSGETCALGSDGMSHVCSCGVQGACAANQSCCGGKCVNLGTNKLNCGKCGVTCAVGEICNSGQCKCGTQLAQPMTGGYCQVASQFCEFASGKCINIDVDHCPKATAYNTGQDCKLSQPASVCCGFCDDPTTPADYLFFCRAGGAPCPGYCAKTYP